MSNEAKINWMQKAIFEANKALKQNEVPIGAVIIKDNKIIGRGYNQVEGLLDSTAHAEIIAISSAANSLKDWRLNDCSIYVTKEPCLMCYGAIVNSRIKEIYFGFSDSDHGFKSKIDETQSIYKTHLKKIEGNISSYECRKILTDFFKYKRKK